MNRFERWLRASVPYKELGWDEIGEKFTRFVLIKTRWFSLYAHRLDAPVTHPKCHDHPWHFWTAILAGGYHEDMNGKRAWRGPGTVLYRPAASLHNTTTLAGEPMWSLVLVSGRVRDWGFEACDVRQETTREQPVL